MLKEAVNKVMRRHRRRKSRSVVDSAARNAASLSDGCNPELVKGASFEGFLEIPIIKKPETLIVPDGLVPFSKMEKADPKAFAVCEYENDTEFKDILVNPKDYIKVLRKYQGFISPDCSVYRDMPLSLQITNIYEFSNTYILKKFRLIQLLSITLGLKHCCVSVKNKGA